MELIKLNLNNIFIPNNMVACIGIFDGIHCGHNKVISKVIEISKKNNMKSGLITFDPHPDFVLKKINNEQYITPLNDRLQLFNEYYNLDYVIVIDFTIQLASLTYEQFYDLFLQKIKTIVVGEGFRFGYKNIGTVDMLKQLHGENNIISVPHECYLNENDKVSSQDIFNLLKNGKIAETIKLGVKYKINGIISKGSQIGTKIGYPTANVDINEKYCLIKNGVYAVIVKVLNNKYLAIANYGYNPSFNKVDKPRLEVHIFEFNNNIYGEKVEVEFIDFIREETIFSSIDQFLTQLKLDCNTCINKYGGKYETVNCRGNG